MVILEGAFFNNKNATPRIMKQLWCTSRYFWIELHGSKKQALGADEDRSGHKK